MVFLGASEGGAGKWERGEFLFLFECVVLFCFLPRYQVPIPKSTSHAQSYDSREGLAELSKNLQIHSPMGSQSSAITNPTANSRTMKKEKERHKDPQTS